MLTSPQKRKAAACCGSRACAVYFHVRAAPPTRPVRQVLWSRVDCRQVLGGGAALSSFFYRGVPGDPGADSGRKGHARRPRGCFFSCLRDLGFQRTLLRLPPQETKRTRPRRRQSLLECLEAMPRFMSLLFLHFHSFSAMAHMWQSGDNF